LQLLPPAENEDGTAAGSQCIHHIDDVFEMSIHGNLLTLCMRKRRITNVIEKAIY
jgi:hypothetical protein